jgi:glycosyltransferase involved in cell wall biosynthesis
MLNDGADSLDTFEAALQQLVAPARAGTLTMAMRADDPLAALVEAWEHNPQTHGLRCTLGDALQATDLLEHALRALAVEVPRVDLCHAVANGLAALVGLTAMWDHGTPLLMSEHGVYLRERYLALRSADLSPVVRMIVLRFFRRVSELGYRRASLIAPCTSYNQRWEVQGGADPACIVTVPNGVDPGRYPMIDGEPAEPVLSWVGRIDPLKDVETLLRSFAVVHAEMPAARLRIFGPVPKGNEEYAQRCFDLAASLGITDVATFEGPVPSSREAFVAGQVVVLSSISEGLPYSVIEAMMCGRATVSTNVGGVAECVGDTGLVVQPRDPAAFAGACLRLLRDRRERHEMAAAARLRALGTYTLDRLVGSYRLLYSEVAEVPLEPSPPLIVLPAAGSTAALVAA